MRRLKRCLRWRDIERWETAFGEGRGRNGGDGVNTGVKMHECGEAVAKKELSEAHQTMAAVFGRATRSSWEVWKGGRYFSVHMNVCGDAAKIDGRLRLRNRMLRCERARTRGLCSRHIEMTEEERWT